MKPISRTGKKSFHAATAPAEEVVAALMGLYARQTLEEATNHTTAESNGIGFSAFDASILTSICEYVSANSTISEKQLTLVRTKLNKYRRQIQSIDLSEYIIPDLKVVDFLKKKEVSDQKELSCTRFGSDSLRLDFGYDEKLLAKVKTLSSRRYHSKGIDKYWTCPILPKNIRALLNMGFPVPEEIVAELDKHKREISFLGLKKELRPYQVSGVTRMAGELDLRALLADEMGLGKTAQALAALHARRQDALPALVICPASLKWNWAREVNMWLPDVTVRVLGGFSKRRSYKPRKNEIAIVNYDVLANQKDKNGKLKNMGWASILAGAGHKTIILDECHKIKNQKSKRNDAVRILANKIKYMIAISGTPIESRPAEFYPVLSMLDPRLFPNWWTFAHRYCGAVHTGWAWDFTGSSNIEELHSILTENIMVRRLKKDVLKDLPAKIRSVVPVEINMKDYLKEENELRSYLARLRNDEIPKDKKNAEGLARIERMKQAAVVGKMAAAKDWISNYLDSDKKLVVFATHTFVLDELEKEFKSVCVRVDGSVSDKKRQECVDRFQSDEKVRLFLGNTKAAGVGITLTAASDTLTLELGWTPGEHDQAEDRVHRMGQEAESVNAYYLIARGTIEEEIAQLLDQKRQILEQVLDGKQASQSSLLKILLTKYEEE